MTITRDFARHPGPRVERGSGGEDDAGAVEK